MGEEVARGDLEALFNEYELSDERVRMVHAMKKLRNMPSFFATLADEELVWAVAVATVDLPSDPSNSDLKFYERTVEERVRKLEAAEETYRWFSLRWTKLIMRRLLVQWFCGMLVIVPELQTKEGHPIQFVREFYGEESGYPGPEGQTDEWKEEGIELYVLMARSTCRAYPAATTKGIVSLSDMQDFDWDKYDMGSKERNYNIASLIPNKLSRMITFHPDDKMRKFCADMGARARKKWGFEQYDDLEKCIEGQGDFLPKRLPTFVGGDYQVDILECMKYLFRREPDALALLLEMHAEMEKAGELPRPRHMESNWR